MDKRKDIIWDAIKQENDQKKALDMLADVTERAFEETNVSIDKVNSKLADINKILCGNGNPSHSIIARLEDIEKYVSTVGKVLISLVILVLGEILMRLLGLF